MTSKLTREQRINEVKELIANAEEWAGFYEHPIHDKPQREMFEGMAKVMSEHLAALAAMDSDPVATLDVQSGRPDGNKFALAYSSAAHKLPDDIYYLYRHAQQPVVPRVTCWSCRNEVEISAIGDCDGRCPKCDTQIHLDEEPYTSPQPAPDRDQVRREHAEWSQATFGNVGPVGPLKHLSKEALEAAAEPDDLSEWADMQFLLWDAQRRAGITDEQITLAMIEKLAVNKLREWPAPKDGEPRLHIKEQPAPVAEREPIAWLNDAYLARGVVDGEAGSEDAGPGYIPVYREAGPKPVPDDYQHLRELYHAQEKRLFKIAQRIKGPAFDKYSHSPSQAIDVLEVAIFGEDESCRAAMLQAGTFRENGNSSTKHFREISETSTGTAITPAAPDKKLTDDVLDEIIAGAKTSMEQYLALSLKAEREVWRKEEPTDDERIMAIEGMIGCLRCGDNGWVVGEMGITRCACGQPGNSPVIPDGWQLVPVEPNGNMLAAAQDAYGETEGDIASTLRAAIAAAPQEVKGE